MSNRQKLTKRQSRNKMTSDVRMTKIALRMLQIQLSDPLLEKVIKVYEKMKETQGKVTIKQLLNMFPESELPNDSYSDNTLHSGV